MKPVPHCLSAAILAGGMFTGLFLGSWPAYFWGDGDGDRAMFCTIVEVFAGPLLPGSVLVLRGQRLGFHLLRFGSSLFICDPITFFSLWELEDDPQYVDYLSWRRH
jgi:hypothetical protein